jgi:cation:H+ antiporter
MQRVAGVGTPLLLVVFAVGAAATWVAGVYLSRSTDALDDRLRFGEAVGGMVFLAVAGSLPEVAITISAALAGNLGLASGNLIGGIATQTLVLVLCDAVISGERPLTFMVGSLIPVLEALMVVIVVTATVAGGLLPSSTSIGPVSPASVAIVLLWVGGLVVLNRVRKDLRWRVVAPESNPGRPDRRVRHPTAPRLYAGRSTARVVAVFVTASAVTLVAGVVLANSGSALADRGGINGVVFGATILAAVTALPEVSSGIAATGLGDYQLAMGDIFGGNAFQVCLFLLADLVAGKPVLPSQGNANSWIGELGLILTAVYGAGIIARPRRRFGRLGPDSIAVLALYAVGVAGLLVVRQ